MRLALIAATVRFLFPRPEALCRGRLHIESEITAPMFPVKHDI